jgi:hypothetical protein
VLSVSSCCLSGIYCRRLRQPQPRPSLSLLCCCSALGRHPAPSTRRCFAAQRVRLQGLSPRPIPAAVCNHLRMSGGKACGKACGKQAAQYAGKQPDEGSAVTRRDTTAPENEGHSSDHTHRQSMRLKEMSAAKQAGGKGETEKGKQSAAQKKRTRTTRQATQTQPLLLAADAFVAALGAVPAEDWCRTWAAGRTIMLRRTSKKIKEAVDKMRLPAVVRLSSVFWRDASYDGTDVAKLEFVLRQLAAMTAWSESPHSSCRSVE